MDPVIRRIVFEELAADRGNPIARPDIWWDNTEQKYPQRAQRMRMLVDAIKIDVEKSLVVRRAKAGFIEDN